VSYVRKVVSNQEKLLCVFHASWSYVAEGLFWFITLITAGLIIDHYFYQYVGPNTFLNIDFWSVHLGFKLSGISIIFAVIGLAILGTLSIVYISSEIGLTDQRVIYKKGLIFIQVDQVDLEDIRAEQVFHGWFGWLLGYGRVRLDCRFIHDIWLPTIHDPYRLVKASHNARLKHPLIEYGQDEFQANLQRIETQKQRDKNKFKKLQRIVKQRFQKAA
jgi:hypothetical protein